MIPCILREVRVRSIMKPVWGLRVVLAAAGIGVSPFMGILRYIDEATDAEVTLFQSASVFDELIYFDEIDEASREQTLGLGIIHM